MLALAPHPSLLIMLVNYHLKTLDSPIRFTIHLLVIYTLTFCLFSSVIVCVARDPGPVVVEQPYHSDDDGMDLTEALMAEDRIDNLSAPGRFCRKCWAPKPERAHHCSVCGRCVLKMGMFILLHNSLMLTFVHRSSLRVVGIKMHCKPYSFAFCAFVRVLKLQKGPQDISSICAFPLQRYFALSVHRYNIRICFVVCFQ